MRRQKASVSTDLVRFLLHYASSVGLDMNRIMAVAGKAMNVLESPDSRIPIEQLDVIWRAIVGQSTDPDFGLHLGEASDRHTSGGILFAVMMNCGTVGSTLDKLIRYHDISTDLIQLRLEERGEFASYVWEQVDSPIYLDRHFAETAFCGLLLPLRRLTQDSVQPAAIHFKHPKPAGISEHRRIFNCPLVFDCPRNEMLLHRSDLAKPIFLANPQLLDQLEQLAQEMMLQLYPPDAWADRVARLINQSLSRGEKPLLGAVASELALSPRHLQNKLKGEGVSFQALLDQIRKEVALKYLDQPHSTVCDVAYLLGFSEQSAFNHAFKRWTGLTPGEYRKLAR